MPKAGRGWRVSDCRSKKTKDRDEVKEAARLAARRAAQRWSGKKPQVQVIVLEG